MTMHPKCKKALRLSAQSLCFDFLNMGYGFSQFLFQLFFFDVAAADQDLFVVRQINADWLQEV